MGFLPITTNDGDTWADLAQRAYGDVTKIPDLMADNPHVPARPVIKGGTKILCEVIAREDTATNLSNLPPWKK